MPVIFGTLVTLGLCLSLWTILDVLWDRFQGLWFFFLFFACGFRVFSPLVKNTIFLTIKMYWQPYCKSFINIKAYNAIYIVDRVFCISDHNYPNINNYFFSNQESLISFSCWIVLTRKCCLQLTILYIISLTYIWLRVL